VDMAKTLLKICWNFEKSGLKVWLFNQALNVFLHFDDSELEEAMTADVIQSLLHVFDVCRRVDIVHTKVFKILQKIPLKINSDVKITNTLKNFCYYCKIEKTSSQGKQMTNVSIHFLYQLMEFFEFKGDNEYDGILKTWMEELKELFGKKLLMESDMSDLEESHLRNSALEINADFNFFGEEGAEKEETPPKKNFFEFDFTQPKKSLVKSDVDNSGFGMSQGEFENPPPLGVTNASSNFDQFDFDAFDNPSKKTHDFPESPIKSSSKKGNIILPVTNSRVRQHFRSPSGTNTSQEEDF
jgi:hypothetical protein